MMREYNGEPGNGETDVALRVRRVFLSTLGTYYEAILQEDWGHVRTTASHSGGRRHFNAPIGRSYALLSGNCFVPDTTVCLEFQGPGEGSMKMLLIEAFKLKT